MTSRTLPANAPETRGRRIAEHIAELYALPLDKAFVASVRGETRSDRQRKYWFAVVVPLVRAHARDHHGIDKGKDVWHEYLKNRFIGVTEDAIHRTVVRVHPSTGDLSRAAFAELVEEVQAWASVELGLFIPDPDPEWRNNKAAQAATEEA